MGKMLFEGRNRVRYNYSRFGYTRGGGKTWHGGLDVEGLDSTTIRMPWYNGKEIRGTVTRARMVTDHSNPTWEWGWYVCVQLDAKQTPDAVNFLYICHNARNLVQVGQKVKSGDALAIMGNTGNAALADPPFAHCHLEARATATGKGLDPTAYAGIPNEVGTYGTAPAAGELRAGAKLQLQRVPLYGASAAANAAGTVSGDYWLWDGEETNGRTRITNRADRVGAAGQVTGWIAAADARAAMAAAEPEEPEEPGDAPAQPTAMKMTLTDPDAAAEIAAKAAELGLAPVVTIVTEPASSGDYATLRNMVQAAGGSLGES